MLTRFCFESSVNDPIFPLLLDKDLGYNKSAMATKQYTREELQKLYKKLPQELKDVINSADTGEHLSAACERNGVSDELIPHVAKTVGNVLMGVLLPTEFQGALVKEVGLEKSTAQEVARDMNRFIFYPVKLQLEQLHRIPTEETKAEIGIPTPRHSDELEALKTMEEGGLEKGPPKPAEEEPEKDPDRYRESL